MKKIVAIILSLSFAVCLASCETHTHESEIENPQNISSEEVYTPATIKTSPDKYTWYIKDYVGKNCSTLGYTSLGGDRMDRYGSALLELIFVTEDGSYVDFENEDVLKEYMVSSQNIPPNSELKLVFQTDSEGKEYDNLVSSQSYEEIVLSVKKVGDKNKSIIEMTEIQPSPDKYTWYIADYVGRNLADCGYTSLGGERRVKYGDGSLKVIIVTDDGSLVDINDSELLKQYVVTNQNIAPNTELSFTFLKDSNEIEYDNLVGSQNIEEIELYVKKFSK